MKITILNGSSRHNAQSGKITRFLEKELNKLFKLETYILDLTDNPLPLWDESIWAGSPKWKEIWDPIKKELQSSDAFIFVVPEWGGMAPPQVKNFFLLSSVYELGHKPALLVSVSSARNGVYPISELRASSYKNNRVVYLPEHLIVRDAEAMLNGESPANEDDRYLRDRSRYCLQILHAYAEALKPVRAANLLDHKKYPNGM